MAFRKSRYDMFDDFFYDMFDDPFFTRQTERNIPQLMRTDILEKDGHYLLEIELPGYTRDDIKAELKDGYLTILVQKQEALEGKEEKTRFVRKERYTGSMKRSFYVGEKVTEHDIQAGFQNGILKVIVNKPKPRELEDGRKLIPIL